MPLLRKEPFVKEKPPVGLKPTDEVFHCKITSEIFTDYEKFFERIILCNSLVWTCSETGRPGLTFQEAVESESKARKQIAQFPEHLIRPILCLTSKTQRTRLSDVLDDVFAFAKDRYFVSETVEVMLDGERKQCQVMKVIAQGANKESAEEEKKEADVIVLDSDEEEDMPLCKLQKSPRRDVNTSDFGLAAEKFQYVVQELRKTTIYIVDAKQISRKKGVFTRDRCKLFLKRHCGPVSTGIWKVKIASLKKYRIENLVWTDHFDGELPTFGLAKSKKSNFSSEEAMIKQVKKERKEKKKIEKEMKKMDKEKKKDIKKAMKSLEKQRMKEEKKRLNELEEKQEIALLNLLNLVRNIRGSKQLQSDEASLEEKLRKMNPEQRVAFKEQLKQERLAEKLKQKEELRKAMEERRQKLKEERDKLREKKKEEERERKQYLREYNRPRDDLQCDDLKPLPVATPVQSRVPPEYFGDTMIVLEFLTCFNSLLELDQQFPHKITLDALGEALQESSVTGLFADLVSFLLTTIFQLEEEEEEYDDDEEALDDATEENKAEQDVSFRDLVKQATIAAQIPHQNFGTPLNKLHIDGFTLTEVLRLHFLASGAKGSERNNRFRHTERGGYCSTDDAGLEFKRQEAHIIRTIGESNIFDLNPGDKLKILTALIQQLMTYVACRDVIEENLDAVRATRNELRAHQFAVSRREKDEAHFWFKKRVEEKKKEQVEKAREREEKKAGGPSKPALNGDVVDLCADSDSQNGSRAATPSGASPEDTGRKGARGKNAQAEQRHSGRIMDKTQTEVLEAEQQMENIEWDKITPDERVAMRNRYEKKERELCAKIARLQHSAALHPLGLDRTFRRFWVFQSVPGLFVEDTESNVPDDYFQDLRTQKGSEADQAFKSSNLPLGAATNGVNVGEGDVVAKSEKLGSSDKENDSFDQNKAALEAMDTRDTKAAETDKTDKQTAPDIVITDANGHDINKSENTGNEESSKFSAIQTVHDQINARRKYPWAFYNSVEQLNALIAGLNARGLREGPLKQCLLEQRKLLADSLTQCPVRMLSISAQDSAATSVRFQKVKSRNRNIQGAVMNASASEFLELNLREQLLDMEERIFVGGLGALKVNDRLRWRDAIEGGNYDPQCESITWGAESTVTEVKAHFSKPSPAKVNGDVEANSENGAVDTKEPAKSSAAESATKPEAGDDSDDETSGQQATRVVAYMARALLQISQMLEPRFLKTPLGEDEETRLRKQKEALELAFQGLTPTKIKARIWERKRRENGAPDSDEEDAQAEEESKKTGMERWQESLMACNSLSQVFLHISVLDSSIIWDKSALHARCKICRRKGDDEKMLLCDCCDGGYHMYCLRPPMKKIPKDDWYCSTCKPKDLALPKKRRKSTFDDSLTEDYDTATTEPEEESSDEDSEEDDEDSEEETEEDTDDYDEDTEVEENEQTQEPAKIKFSKGFKGGNKSSSGVSSEDRPGSGSRGGSARSSRSNTPTRSTTPKQGGRARTSLEKAMQLKAVASKAGKGYADKRKPSRHSIETEQPSSRKSSRRSATDSANDLQSSSRSSRPSRHSLEPPSSSRAASKRRSEPQDDSDSGVPKNKRRGSEKVNMMQCCEDLLTELSKRDESWPFQAPVTKRDAPDYFDVIKKPMDLGTIRKKLFEVEYASPAECIADMRLIFSNCASYNQPLAAEYIAGEKLSRYLEKRIRELGLERGNAKGTTKGSPAGGRKGRAK